MSTQLSASSSDEITDPGYVWVYQYTYWEEALKMHRRSERFATLELIRCGLGEPIHSSAKKIRLTDLIEGGFAE